MLDISLANIWKSWQLFRRGKQPSPDIDEFAYNLESNLFRLWQDLNNGSYRHGGYRKFMVADNKRREIFVAPVRDRVVHRLVYEYLSEIYDKTFIYDVWSCRKGKGVIGAIDRTQNFLFRFRKSFVWRADISKFFDNVDQCALWEVLRLRINNVKALELLEAVIGSYYSGGVRRERERVRNPASAFPLAT